jgi:hypothetical protein
LAGSERRLPARWTLCSAGTPRAWAAQAAADGHEAAVRPADIHTVPLSRAGAGLDSRTAMLQMAKKKLVSAACMGNCQSSAMRARSRSLAH